MSEYRLPFYDRDGIAIGHERYAQLMEDPTYRFVGRTQLDDKRLVSTVWLGIDHGLFDDSEPIIFETAVCRDGEWDIIARYSSLADATAGHEHICRIESDEAQS